MQTKFEALNDSQWEVIKEFVDYKRKRELDLRVVFNAIFYILRTGIQWRNLPETYPDWQAVYYYYNKWKKNGTIEHINIAVNKLDRLREEREATPSLLLADSQSIKLAPLIYEDRGIDGNKKVNGRKRQILTDTGGRIWITHVHAANISDDKGGQALLKDIDCFKVRLQKILTDAGYKEKFKKCVEHLGLKFEVSSRPESVKGFVPIKIRWVVERTFGWMNFFRRLVKDYEYTVSSAQTWILLGNIAVMLNRIG